MKTIASVLICCFMLVATGVSAQQFEKDSFVTKRGQLDITFIKHGSLLFTYNGSTIYIDPVAAYADYSKLPKADVILITHEHGDHLDPKAIADIKKEGTILVVNSTVYEQLGEGLLMKNGDEQRLTPYLYVKAVPAYNHEIEPVTKEPEKELIVASLIDDTNLIDIDSTAKKGNRKRNNDKKEPQVQPIPVPVKPAAVKREVYHPRHSGNGYVLTIDDKRIYVAGDTEDIIEMAELKDIDIAFLPVNQPYTMTPKQAANAALMFNPTILYPYHYGATRIQELVDLLRYDRNIEVRIRELQ